MTHIKINFPACHELMSPLVRKSRGHEPRQPDERLNRRTSDGLSLKAGVMPGLVELVYTTAGGIIGATAQNYLTKHQERRQARAAVLECVRQVEDTIENVRALVKRSGPRRSDVSIGSLLGIEANLADGSESRRALAKIFGGLEAAALIAGVPRDAVDLYRRIASVVLEARVMWLMAYYAATPSVTGESLINEAGELQLHATALLSSALWHPWRFRIRIRSHIQPLEAALCTFRELLGREHARRRHPAYAGPLYQALGLDVDHIFGKTKQPPAISRRSSRVRSITHTAGRPPRAAPRRPIGNNCPVSSDTRQSHLR